VTEAGAAIHCKQESYSDEKNVRSHPRAEAADFGGRCKRSRGRPSNDRSTRRGRFGRCDKGGLTGIFTGRDAVFRVLAEGKNPAKTTLREVMTPDPETITPRHNAIDALRLMQDARCRHLPIVNDGMILGIVSRGDFRGTELDRFDEETGLWEHIG
jgi:CBS domain-containing protein